MNIVSHPILSTAPRGRFTVDIATGRLSARGVTLPTLTVERLDARLADPGVVRDLFEATDASEAQRTLLGARVMIDDVRLRVPQETLSEGLQKMMPSRHPELTLSGRDRFRLTGHIDHRVTVPYDLDGTLGRTEDGRPYAEIEHATAFGVLPAMFFACMMVASRLERNNLDYTRDGSRFTVDAGSAVPGQARFRLRDVHVDGTDLIMRGQGSWTPPSPSASEPEVWFDAVETPHEKPDGAA